MVFQGGVCEIRADLQQFDSIQSIRRGSVAASLFSPCSTERICIHGRLYISLFRYQVIKSCDKGFELRR